MESQKRSIFILVILMFVVMLGTAGIALPYPVLAPYFLGDEANGLNTYLNIPAEILLGIALSVFPLGALLGSPFVGVLADRFGNKVIMLHSLWLSLVGYLLTAFAIGIESFPLFIFARLVTGLCQGNITIARALSAELHPVINHAKSQSLIFSAVYSGWLLGPALGGYLMVFGPSQVFIVAALMVFLCMAVCFLFLPPSDNLAGNPQSIWQELRNNNSLSLLKIKSVQPIAWFYFLYALGLNGFYEYYPAWMVEYFDFDSVSIANVSIALTLVMVVCSAAVYPQLHRIFGTHRVMMVGTILTGISFLVLPLISYSGIFMVFAIIGAFIAIGNGAVPTYLSEKFSSLGLAKVLGLQTLIFYGTNSLMACIGGLIAVFDVVYVLVGSGLLLLLAGATFQVLTTKLEKTTAVSC